MIKHIARAELSVRELVSDKIVSIHLVPTHLQLSDLFTKALPLSVHCRNVEALMGISKLADADAALKPGTAHSTYAPHACR